MHSASVFEELGKYLSVIIACKSEDYGTFGSLQFRYAKVFHINNTRDVDDLIFSTIDWIHVNNVFKVYPGVEDLGYALRLLLKRNCIVFAINMEQYQWWTVKGFLRRLQWFYLFNIGQGRKIQAIGCTGKTGINAFRKAFVSSRRLFDFIYTVPAPNSYLLEKNNSQTMVLNKANNVVSFLILGQIISRKCILECVKTFNLLNEDYNLEIVGGGDLEKQLSSLIKNNPRIHYYGKLMPLQVRDLLKYTDVLLLASKSEGWGCTVNEALMYGNRVIVSDCVGSRDLILNRDFCGTTFESENWDNLKSCILQEIKRGPRSKKERLLISQWAKCIYPESAANYFLNVVEYYICKLPYKPIAPWQNK